MSVEFFIKRGAGSLQDIPVQGQNIQTALRNTQTGAVYSKIVCPDISGYAKDGYDLVWTDPVYDGQTYKLYAQYMPKNLKITMYSAVQIEGAQTATNAAEYTGGVYVINGGMPSGYTLADAQSAGYEFLGWFCKTSAGEWKRVQNLCLLDGISDMAELEIHAAWFGGISQTALTCYYTTQGRFIKTYTYNAQFEFAVTVLGPSSLNMDVTFDIGLYATKNTDFGSAAKTVTAAATKNGFVYTAKDVADAFDQGNSINGLSTTAHANVGVTVSFGGAEIFTLAATENTHYTCGITAKQ